MSFIENETCDDETYAVQPRIYQKPKKSKVLRASSAVKCVRRKFKKRNAQAEQKTKFIIRIYTNMTIESE